MGDMTPVDAVETPAAGHKDLLVINRVGHISIACGWMGLLTVGALRVIQPSSLKNQGTGQKQCDVTCTI